MEEEATTQESLDPSILDAESSLEQDTSLALDLLSSNDYDTIRRERATTVATDSAIAAKAALSDVDSPENMLNKFRAINQELSDTGVSGTLNEIRSRQRQRSQEIAKLAGVSMLADGSFGNFLNAPEAFRETFKQIDETTADQNFAMQVASNSTSGTWNPNWNNIVEEQLARERVQSSANRMAAETMSGESSAFFKGVAVSFLPFIESEQIRRHTSTLLKSSGQDGGKTLKSYLMTGSVKMEFVKALDEMYKRNPQEAERVAGELISNFRSNTDIILKDDFSAYFRLKELLGVDDGEYTTLYKYVDNIAVVADFIGAGGFIKKLKTPIKSLKAYLKFEAGATGKTLHRVFLKGDSPEHFAKVRERAANIRAIRARQNATLNSVGANSAGRVVADYDPKKARVLYQVALQGDEQATIALFGTAKKADVAIDGFAPQIRAADGSIANKVALHSEDPLRDLLKAGVDRLDESEMIRIRNKLAVSFTNPSTGFTVRNEMTTIDNVEGGSVELSSGVRIASDGDINTVTAAYSLGGDVAQTNVSNLLDYAEWAFRHHGVSKDNMVVLKRTGTTWKTVDTDVESLINLALEPKVGGKKLPKAEVGSPQGVNKLVINKLKEVNKQRQAVGKDVIKQEDLEGLVDLEFVRRGGNEQPAEYMIALKHSSKAMLSDADEVAKIDVRNNFVDRMFARYNGNLMSSDFNFGSLQQHISSVASMFKDRFMHLAMSNAEDRSSQFTKILVKAADSFNNKFKKLDGASKQTVTDYIVQANLNQTKFNAAKLRTEGWSEAMLSTVTDFRLVQDRLYVLENTSRIQNARGRGLKMWVVPGTDESKLVKPMKLGQVTKELGNGTIKLYDHKLGQIVDKTRADVEKLFKEGGEVAELDVPTALENGKFVTHILVDNTPGNPFIRRLRDDDKVLNYLEGYYSRRYNDEYIIRQSVKDDRGDHVHWRAVGSADSLKSANALREQFNKKFSNVEYVVSRDLKGTPGHERALAELDMLTGRSAQRMRGEKPLETLGGDLQFEMASTTNPMQSMLTSIRSISQHVNAKDWIETSKERFIRNYGAFLEKHPITNQPMYPSKGSDIRQRTPELTNVKEVAAARSAFNYIRSIEDGYINHLDAGFKGLMNVIADVIAPTTSVGEKVFRGIGDMRGPLSALRTLTATTMLFMNPLRQALVQTIQSVQLAAIANPKWTIARSAPQALTMIKKFAGGTPTKAELKASGWTQEEFDKVFNGLEQSGLLAAVDKNNLVRGVMYDAEEFRALGTVKKTISAIPHYSRTIGMDAGERMNMLMHYLAFADSAKRAGKDLGDARVLSEISGNARNLSGNMNAAGDLPYNQNLFSLPAQFLQIGHKMLSNMTFNQHLTKGQKARLALVNAALFGFPAQSMYESGVEPYLPENEELRNLVTEGIMSYAINSSIHAAFDTNTRLDISGNISPFNNSLGEFVTSLVKDDFLTMMAESPSGSLFFGGNPKAITFLREVKQWIVPSEELQPASLKTVGLAFGNLMSSGFSNAYKAAYMYKVGQSMSAKGATKDYVADWYSVAGQVLGIRSMDEVKLAALNTLDYEDSSYKKDIKHLHDNFLRQLALHGQNAGDSESIKQGFAIGYSVFGGTPEFLEEWNKLSDRAASQNKLSPLVDLYGKINTVGIDEVISRMHLLPDEQRPRDYDNVIKALERWKQYNEGKQQDEQ